MPRHFSKETRRKLSEAAKKRWALRKREGGYKWPASENNEAKPSLTHLFSAAVMLSTDDGEALKQAVCNCAKGETIVGALERETAEGTSLQSRMRKQITTFIQNAL